MLCEELCSVKVLALAMGLGIVIDELCSASFLIEFFLENSHDRFFAVAVSMCVQTHPIGSWLRGLIASRLQRG